MPSFHWKKTSAFHSSGCNSSAILSASCHGHALSLTLATGPCLLPQTFPVLTSSGAQLLQHAELTESYSPFFMRPKGACLKSWELVKEQPSLRNVQLDGFRLMKSSSIHVLLTVWNTFKKPCGLIQVGCDPAGTFLNCHSDEFNCFQWNPAIRGGLHLCMYIPI